MIGPARFILIRRRPARRWRPRNRNRLRRISAAGAALIEVAFVLMILLLLAFGTVEFSWFFFVKHNMQGAAREGARAAIVPNATSTTVGAAVRKVLEAAKLQNSGYMVTIDPNPANAHTGDPITVTVQCPWSQVGSGFRPMGLISLTKTVDGTTSPRTVVGTTVMRKE